MKRVSQMDLIHAVRIAARIADKESPRNPFFVEALQLMAAALEEATVSVRSDGNYWLVRIPEPSTRKLHE